MEVINTGKSTYDIEATMLSLSKSFFRHEDGTLMDVSTLRTGLYGWLSGVQSQLAFNGIAMKANLYDEHFLNTAVMPSSIYNKAVDHNFNIGSAQPSNMNIVVGVKMSDIIRIKNDTNISLTISKDTTFTAGTIPFQPMYDVVIDYSIDPSDVNNSKISAVYDFNDGKNFDIDKYDISNPFIATHILPEQGLVLLNVEIYQLAKSSTTNIYNTSDVYEDNKFTIEFPDQLATFNVWYKQTATSTPILMTKYFGSRNSAYSSDSEVKCNYEYLSDNVLSIIFLNKTKGFVPEEGSEITIETFTTKGSAGNVNFTGVFATSFTDSRYFNVELYTKAITVASGGVDKPTVEEYKSKLMNYVQSKGDTITDNDVTNYFDEIKSTYIKTNNEFQISKYRDDIIKREYSAFVLMRDENNIVIPTNTVNVNIGKTNVDDVNINYFNKSDDGTIITIPSGTYIIMKKTTISDGNGNSTSTYSDYKLMSHEDENLFGEVPPFDKLFGENWLAFYKKKKFVYNVYKTPNKLIINKSRFLRAMYFRSSTNEDYDISITNSRSFGGKSFLVSKLNVVRNSMIDTVDKNDYRINFTISTNVEKKYVNNIGSGSDKNKLSAVALIYSLDDNGNRTYHGFKHAKLDMSNELKNPYNFYVNITSMNKSNNYDNMSVNLYPINSDGEITSTTLKEVEIPNKTYVSILVSYDPNDGSTGDIFFDTTADNNLDYARDGANPDLYDVLDEDSNPALIGLSNIINVLEAKTELPVTFNKSLSNVTTSDIFFNGLEYVIKEIPIIKYDYITDTNNFNYLVDSLNEYESMFTGVLGILTQSTSINMKFYNSYGKSDRFSISDTNISIAMNIALKVEENDELHRTITNHIISFVNNINKTGVTRFSFSNLSTSLENTFSDIVSVRLGSINGNKVYDIFEDETLNEMIPEYLNIGYNTADDEFEIKIDYLTI